ncbi:MmpS family transport accessory protein, partial [Mycobacterium tuberculosis]|uniref:MmpS family transport accessory protein n=1 Tax=Mycobacterium tuberculosis TaxID=1773 RepID=UPI002044D57A
RTRGCLLRSTPETSRRLRSQIRESPDSPGRFTDAQPHEVVNAAVPWSFTIVTTLTAVVANVVARGDGASLGCRITVNEVIREERIVNAYHAHTSCLVKSA